MLIIEMVRGHKQRHRGDDCKIKEDRAPLCEGKLEGDRSLGTCGLL